MKKVFYKISLLLFFTALIPSCQLLEDCKSCTLVTNDNGTITYAPSSLTYCGDKLTEIEAEDPQTIGSKTTYWECK
jgi:hypothetical protein